MLCDYTFLINFFFCNILFSLFLFNCTSYGLSQLSLFFPRYIPIKFHSLGDMKASITLSLNVKKVFTLKNAEDSALTDYIRFLVQYTSLVVGKRKILSEFKKDKDMNIFDVLVSSNEAFAIVLYKNNRDKWESSKKGNDVG